MEGVRVPVSVTAGDAAGGGGTGAAAANNIVVGDGGAGLLHRGFERQFGACESVSGLQLVDSFQQEIFDIDILHAFIVSPW